MLHEPVMIIVSHIRLQRKASSEGNLFEHLLCWDSSCTWICCDIISCVGCIVNNAVEGKENLMIFDCHRDCVDPEDLALPVQFYVVVEALVFDPWIMVWHLERPKFFGVSSLTHLHQSQEVCTAELFQVCILELTIDGVLPIQASLCQSDLLNLLNSFRGIQWIWLFEMVFLEKSGGCVISSYH